MCFAYTRPLGVDPTQPAGPGERGRSASAGGGEGRGWGLCRDERMEWRTGHVTPTLDDHVSANVITVIITAYMMKWQKSADAECSHPRRVERHCGA